MASPIVEDVGIHDGTGNVASHNMNMPSNIQAGDILIGILRVNINNDIIWPSGGTDVDWTELDESDSDASNDNISIAWRLADGNEGATVTVTSGQGKSSGLIYRISGATDPTVTPPDISTIAIGTDDSPNPSIVDPSAGIKDYLFLWMGGWEGIQTSPPTGNPTNYSNSQGANSGTAGNLISNNRCAGAEYANTAASENPGSWTISASDNWTVWAVAVHPAVAAIAEIPDPARFVIAGGKLTVS